MKQYLQIILIIVLLTGCATPQIQPEPVTITEYKYKQREAPNLPLPKPLQMDEVKFMIITPENIHAVWQGMKDNGNTLVVYGFKPDGYKKLSGNIQKIFNYIILLQEHDKSIMQYYQKE